MDKKFIHFVQIMCKSQFKSLRILLVKLCEKLNQVKNHVQITRFPHTFSAFFTNFPTTHSPLSPPNLFHFFTGSTITTINIFKERI